MNAASLLRRILGRLAILRGHKMWVAFGLLVFLSGLLVSPVRRIWSGWRAAQARELCERASNLMADGYQDAGISMMRRAYQIAPGDPPMLRTLAKSCDLSTPAAIT